MSIDKKNQSQFFELLTKAQRIMLALPKTPNGDTLGSALALANFLRKLKKDVEIYCETSDFGNLSFLPGLDQIKHQVDFSKDFVISVKTEHAVLDELSYNVLSEQVNIYLKPKQGNFEPADISFGTEVSGYDLIICVDTPNLEALGAVYEKNAELFFNTPKANIDNHLYNENYATLNIVDITASSTAEVLLDLLKNYETNLIDEDIATALLTGIIYETRSFQHQATTPHSFLHASELIKLGARQAEIIRNLFKTKEYPVLKLWGRAMARIAEIPGTGCVYSIVSANDLEKSGAKPAHYQAVAEDFMLNTTNFKISFFLIEQDNGFLMFAGANPNIKLSELAMYFGAEQVHENLIKAQLKDAALEQAQPLLAKALADLKQRLGL